MEKKYMVVGFGLSKEKGEKYSKAYLIRGDKKGTYGYLDTKNVYYTNDIRPIGTIIIVKLEEV